MSEIVIYHEGTKSTKENQGKERGILFQEDMVRANLEGRKSQTRRIIKNWPAESPGQIGYFDWDRPKICYFLRSSSGVYYAKCPYGKPGDRLWVKETFVLERREWVSSDGLSTLDLPIDRPLFQHKADKNNEFDEEYWLVPHYRATDPTPELCYESCDEPECRWIPSIFMPRWASRIWRMITNVRVERVQDISEEDAIAEGIVWIPEKEDLDALSSEQKNQIAILCRAQFLFIENYGIRSMQNRSRSIRENLR